MNAQGLVFVHETDLSTAWRRTTDLVGRSADRKAFHSVTVIDSPLSEDGGIRAAVDELLAHLGLPSVDTVANTIFPRGLADSSANPAELTARYLQMYPRLKKLNRDNARGTYFGRLVAYPSGDSTVDQLAKVIFRLHTQGKTRAPMGAAYEAAIHGPEDLEEHLDVYNPAKDNAYRAFPCLSSLSFQRGRTHLQLLAHYRYEYLISKGYGNYLGLASLLAYVSDQVGLSVGRMTVIAGRTYLDASTHRVGQFLDGLPIDISQQGAIPQ